MAVKKAALVRPTRPSTMPPSQVLAVFWADQPPTAHQIAEYRAKPARSIRAEKLSLMPALAITSGSTVAVRLRPAHAPGKTARLGRQRMLQMVEMTNLLRRLIILFRTGLNLLLH